jgi:pimeloyl-ACP methyl ester carboxylesterase
MNRLRALLAASALALPLAFPIAAGAEAPQFTLFQRSPEAVDASAAVRGLLDVGGRRLNVACDGVDAGGPTVVLEAAFGDPGAGMGLAAVADGVAAFARVCRYDRAGLGQSDPAGAPRTYRAMVDDLRAMLAAAGASGPYVLVGLGSGGTIAQLYADWHPDEIAGMVLVNAPTYAQDQLIGQILPPGPREQYLEAARQEAAAEGLDVGASALEFAGRHSSRAMPAVVLSPTPGWGWPADWPAGAVADASSYWSELQSYLAQSLPGAAHITATRSGHDIAADQPELVVDAVRSVVGSVTANAGAALP